MLSCQRCKQSTNGPQAFLLTCRGCNKTWHHRCHMPPVEDEELMRRIRATNMGDTDNGLGAWTCRRCKKVTPGVAFTASHDDRNSLTSTADTMSTASSMAESHPKQEQELSAGVYAQPLTVHGQSKKDDRQEAAPVKHTFAAKKRTQSSISHTIQTDPTPPRDSDVEMTNITPTKTTTGGGMRSPERSSFRAAQGTGIQISVDIVSATSPDDDVEMRVDDRLTESTTSYTPQAHPPDIRATTSSSVTQTPTHVRAGSLVSAQEEVRSASGAAVQPQVNQDADDADDPEDLYGPPVERRIIRILPSLAEELREQQRRAAAEKENKRAPLAPDWISARHAQDPLWKEGRSAGGRGRRKPAARKLEDSGLNVSELVGCLTLRNSVRAHKT